MPGISRTYTSKAATGNAEKIVIETSDGKSYRVRANQLSGMTEQEINDALNNWLAFNLPAEVGRAGVHINRDGSYVLWTGFPPQTWPEDEVNP